MVSDEVLSDDQSHYEVSLTAGQAFVAFVLLRWPHRSRSA